MSQGRGGGGKMIFPCKKIFFGTLLTHPLSAPLPPHKFSNGPSLNPRKKVKDVWLEQTSVINDCRYYGLVRLDTFRSRQHILMFQVSLERTPSGILQHPDPIKNILSGFYRHNLWYCIHDFPLHINRRNCSKCSSCYPSIIANVF